MAAPGSPEHDEAGLAIRKRFQVGGVEVIRVTTPEQKTEQQTNEHYYPGHSFCLLREKNSQRGTAAAAAGSERAEIGRVLELGM